MHIMANKIGQGNIINEKLNDCKHVAI